MGSGPPNRNVSSKINNIENPELKHESRMDITRFKIFLLKNIVPLLAPGYFGPWSVGAPKICLEIPFM